MTAPTLLGRQGSSLATSTDGRLPDPRDTIRYIQLTFQSGYLDRLLLPENGKEFLDVRNCGNNSNKHGRTRYGDWRFDNDAALDAVSPQ